MEVERDQDGGGIHLEYSVRKQRLTGPNFLLRCLDFSAANLEGSAHAPGKTVSQQELRLTYWRHFARTQYPPLVTVTNEGAWRTSCRCEQGRY